MIPTVPFRNKAMLKPDFRDAIEQLLITFSQNTTKLIQVNSVSLETGIENEDFMTS